MEKRVPHDLGGGGEHSGGLGFVGEFTGGELQPAGAITVMNGGSRGGEGEGWANLALGLGCSWAGSGQPKKRREGNRPTILGRLGLRPCFCRLGRSSSGESELGWRRECELRKRKCFPFSKIY
jgi:hypothetical protein